MHAENNGVRIWYEMHGQGEPTLVMVHGFQIVHSECWKRSYVPFLSRHMRVVTMDLRGNGKSDRPAGGYDLATYAEDVHAVVEAAGLSRFAIAGHSLGSPIAVRYHAAHPGRATHLILLSGFAKQARSENYPHGLPRKILEEVMQYWQANPEAMLKQFVGLAVSEKYCLRQKEFCLEWAHESSRKNWRIFAEAATISADVDVLLKDVDVPTLIVSAERDALFRTEVADYLHEKIRGSRHVVIPEAGHSYLRTWPQVCAHMLDFLKPESRCAVPKRHPADGPKMLWTSSPIGLGHVRRDLAVAREMRKEVPGLTVEWLAAEPVRSFLRTAGERLHPLSAALEEECREFEAAAGAYTLDASEAGWRLDKVFANNFMVFCDAARGGGYDLVVGDESWEVAQYLHYNPTLKTAPFVFLTDFIGVSNVGDDETKRAHVHDLNGTWVEMREIHPEASDLSLFIGEPDDIPDTLFGEGLPNRKKWTEERFRFTGYILPFDPADYTDRAALRATLGFSPHEKILVVAVGGTSVGRPLIEKCLDAQASLSALVPGIRTIVLCGPRIDLESFPPEPGVELRCVTPDPIQWYSACDLAVVQGGLSTTMELTALGRPFLYFPLKDHFEQQECVPLRLNRYRAGVRMDFDRTTPQQLAEAIAANIGGRMSYKPVATDGAKKAATLIVEVLKKGRPT